MKPSVLICIPALLLCLFISTRTSANEKQFRSTIQSQAEIYFLTYYLKDLNYSAEEFEVILSYGSHTPTITSDSNYKSLNRIEIPRQNKIQLDAIVSFLNDDAQMELKESKPCKSLNESILKLTNGFIKTAKQNRLQSQVINKHTGFENKHIFDRYTFDSPTFAKFLVSKVRMRLLLRQLEVIKGFYLIGVDLEEGSPLFSTISDYMFMNRACRPQTPSMTLKWIDNILNQMNFINETYFGKIGLYNLDTDLTTVNRISKSYNLRKGYRKVITYAASFVALEYTSLAMTSWIINSLKGLSILKNVWIKGATHISTDIAVASSLFLTADALVNDSELLYMFFKNLEDYENELKNFVDHDGLLDQDLGLLSEMLKIDTRARKFVLENRSLLFKSRNINQSKKENTQEATLKLKEILSHCPNCHVNPI